MNLMKKTGIKGVGLSMRKNILNKKGVLGLDTAKMFVLAILTLGVIAFAVLVALDALAGTTGLGEVAANGTISIMGNISGGLVEFFTNAGTWFALLAIVIIILVIAVVIVAVNRFGGGRGSGNL